jgi:carbon-monoxide dehydrogenase large subunit
LTTYRKVKNGLVSRASEICDAPKADLVIENGQLIRVLSNQSRNIAKDVLAPLSSLTERIGPVEAMSDFSAKVVPFGSATHLCALTIDQKTGLVRIEKYFVDDCGVAKNHTIVDGQLHGGIVHRISAALYELITYNEEGQLVTSNFMDYTVPTALEIPKKVELDNIETPSPMTVPEARAWARRGQSELIQQYSTHSMMR